MEGKRVLLTLPSEDCEIIEKLVSLGRYKNRSNFIDKAVQNLLLDEGMSSEMSKETIRMIKKALHIKCT